MVVLDSSAVIPLLKIGKLDLIFHNFSEIFVPVAVWEEVVVQGKEFGKQYALFEGNKEKFTHIPCQKKEDAKEFAKNNSIDVADAEVLFLAKEKNDVLLTNDAALHACCVSQGVKVWWLTTLILASVKRKYITKKEAEEVLMQLVSAGGMHLRSDIFVELLLIVRNL